MSIRKSEVEGKLLEICENTLGSIGFRPVDVDCRVSGRSLVRIFIEKMIDAPIPQRVPTLDECAEASRKMGEVLDTVDFIPGGYDLEISSPGLDRRLRVSDDFRSVVNEAVKLKLAAAVPGKGANLTGILLSVNEDSVLIKVDKDEVLVPMASILKANVVWRG